MNYDWFESTVYQLQSMTWFLISGDVEVGVVKNNELRATKQFFGNLFYDKVVVNENPKQK